MSSLKVSDYLIDNYENYYHDLDAEWRRLGGIDKCANIVYMSSDIPHNKILEIGSGDGAILKRLSEINFCDEMYSLEIVTTAVEKINGLKIPTLVECKLYDGYNIPFKNDAFDLVILSHVIEHLEFPRKLLYDAKRVGKHVFIEVPLEDNIRLSENFVFTKTGHINPYSYKTIRWLLQSSGLDIIDQKIFNPSKDVLFYRYGKKGLLQFFLRDLSLKIFPKIARKIFTYHSAFICH